MTTSEHRSNCPLCRLTEEREILTRLVHEDNLLLVVDCLICQVPMVVLKVHRTSFSKTERIHVREVIQKLFANHPNPLTLESAVLWQRRGFLSADMTSPTGWVIDWEQRRIHNHAHCHLRPGPFPGTAGWEKVD